MKSNIKNILVPIDFSDKSLNALNTGIEMAKRHQAILHLLYIQDIEAYYPQAGQLAIVAPLMEDVWEKDQMLLNKMINVIRHRHQVNCLLHVETGSRATVINDQAKLHQADVAVLGTDPELSEQNYLVDSLPYRVLKNTECHLLVVPSTKSVSDFSKILFPVLSQENSIAKLELSKVLIEKNNAEVMVLNVVKKEDLDTLSSLRAFSKKIKFRLKMIASTVSRSSVFTLNTVKELIGISRQEDAQLIIMQANTKRNLLEFFTGSFTQRMVRNAEVPVLFVKDRPELDTQNDKLDQGLAAKLQLNF